MRLKIVIDLSKLSAGKNEPDEAAVILRETADWIERRIEPHAPTNTTKKVRNFESEVVGFLWIG